MWDILIVGLAGILKVNDEFVKNRIHLVFRVLYFVFGMKYVMLYKYLEMLNTKHQKQNTLVETLLFRLFTRCEYYG